MVEKKINITYKLEKIDIKKFKIEAPSLPPTEISDALFEFKTGVRVTLDEERTLIRFEVFVYDMDKTNNLSYIDMYFIFHTIGISGFEIKKNQIKLPDELLLSLLNIVYGTSRGILYEKFQSSFLKNIILPPFDTKKLMGKKSQKLTHKAIEI